MPPDPAPETPARWLEETAGALGEAALTPQEVAALLALARDVAHTVERKMAPLTTFLAGLHAGRAGAVEAGRGEAVAEAARIIRSRLPAAEGS